MEKKYIEVNELLKSFTPDCIVYNSNKPIKIDLRLIKRIITRQPIADVKEVKHGEWKTELDEFGWNKNTCTHCGYVKRTDIHVSLGWNFCPKCGADMKKGG